MPSSYLLLISLLWPLSLAPPSHAIFESLGRCPTRWQPIVLHPLCLFFYLLLSIHFIWLFQPDVQQWSIPQSWAHCQVMCSFHLTFVAAMFKLHFHLLCIVLLTSDFTRHAEPWCWDCLVCKLCNGVAGELMLLQLPLHHWYLCWSTRLTCRNNGGCR